MNERSRFNKISPMQRTANVTYVLIFFLIEAFIMFHWLAVDGDIKRVHDYMLHASNYMSSNNFWEYFRYEFHNNTVPFTERVTFIIKFICQINLMAYSLRWWKLFLILCWVKWIHNSQSTTIHYSLTHMDFLRKSGA